MEVANMKEPQTGYNFNTSNRNERESYFGFIFSSFKKSKNKNKHIQRNQPPLCNNYKVERSIKNDDVDSKADIFMQEKRRNQSLMNSSTSKGDVDCEAELFIREKRKKMLFSKTMSFFVRK